LQVEVAARPLVVEQAELLELAALVLDLQAIQMEAQEVLPIIQAVVVVVLLVAAQPYQVVGDQEL
jgi:hypothetical protein